MAWAGPACLFTDALPEPGSGDTCQLLEENRFGRQPVHGVCLLGDSNDHKRRERKIIEEAARQAGGSFQAVGLPSAASEKVHRWRRGLVHAG